ncbi:MAG: OmpA family protein [Gammaproteobacteria bacterium]
MTTATNSQNPSQFRIRWIGVLAAGVLIIGAAMDVRAEQVRLFTGPAPAADELANMMFPERAAPPQVRTRSIVFVNQATAPQVQVKAKAKPQQQARLAPQQQTKRAPKKQQTSRKSKPVPRQTPEGFGFLINFAFDSADVLPDSRPYLDKVGEMMRLPEVADKSIVIEGHTDASGSTAYNKHLSELRALAIKQYLIERHEIDPSRLIVVGKGEAELLPNRSPSDSVNRRVQFHRALN